MVPQNMLRRCYAYATRSYAAVTRARVRKPDVCWICPAKHNEKQTIQPPCRHRQGTLKGTFEGLFKGTFKGPCRESSKGGAFLCYALLRVCYARARPSSGVERSSWRALTAPPEGPIEIHYEHKQLSLIFCYATAVRIRKPICGGMDPPLLSIYYIVW